MRSISHNRNRRHHEVKARKDIITHNKVVLLYNIVIISRMIIISSLEIVIFTLDILNGDCTDEHNHNDEQSNPCQFLC